jgi:hypothetical protein
MMSFGLNFFFVFVVFTKRYDAMVLYYGLEPIEIPNKVLFS